MATSSDILENYQKLAAAILAEAVYAYRSRYRYLLHQLENPNAEAWGITRTKGTLSAIEREFASEFYAVLLKGIGSDINGEEIPAVIRREEEKRHADRSV